MTPEIVVSQPPNYEKLLVEFPFIADQPYMLYSWGDKLYNPSGKEIPPEKIVHEMVHGAQQKEVGVEWWWDTYIADKAFRMQEEIPAYQADYKSFCRHHKDRNHRNDYLQFIAVQLSGPLYGSLCTREEAVRLIKNEQ